MPLELDHIVVAARDLKAAMQTYQDMGYTVVRGGVHANRATENALITFADGSYLELLARTGETPLPKVADFSALLDDDAAFPGYALRASDIEAEAARLRAEGFDVAPIVGGERRRADGVLVQWKSARLDGGFSPFLIEDITPRDRRISTDPAVTTHRNGAVGIDSIAIAVTDLAASEQRYRRLLGPALTAGASVRLEARLEFHRPETLTAFTVRIQARV